MKNHKSFSRIILSAIILFALLLQLLPVGGMSLAAEYRENFMLTGEINDTYYSSIDLELKNGFCLTANDGWAFWKLGGADINGVAGREAVYCVHPGKPTSSGIKYKIDTDSKYLSSIVNDLTTVEEKKFLISLVLSKGEQRSFSYAVDECKESWLAYGAKYLATQALIWEVVTEDRDSNFDIVNTSSTAVVNMKKGFTATGKSNFDIYYNEYAALVKSELEKIELPKTVNLSYDGENYTATITDDRLSNCKVVSTPSGVTVKIKGNNMVVTSHRPLTSADEVSLSQTFSCSGSEIYLSESGKQQELTKPSTSEATFDYHVAFLPKTPQLGKIEIHKISANSEFTDNNAHYSLEGAKFTVTGNGIHQEVVTDANGHAETTDNLPFGEYIVKEIQAPKGYVLNTEEYKVVINAETPIVNAVSIASTNISETPKGGYIKIQKEDSVTASSAQGKATLKGAVFEVYNDNNKLVATVNCGNNDYGITGLLPLGTYIVKEVKAPTGYMLNSEEFTVVVNETAENTVTVQQTVKDDVIKGTVTIWKYKVSLSADGQVLERLPFESVEFTLKSKTTGIIYKGINAVTDENGKIVFNDLPYDDYEIIETVPHGYKPAPNKTVSITESKNYEIEIENEVLLETLVIQKTTKENYNIEGIPFTITGKTIDGRDYTTTVVTDKDGVARVTLPRGDYTIKEEKCEANKYYIIPEEKAVSVDDFETVNFHNVEQSGSLAIDKFIQNANSEYSIGANISFRLSGTSYAGYAVDRIETTNEEGKVYFNNVPVGVYLLTEIANEDNEKYILFAPMTVAIANNTQVHLPIHNNLKTSHIVITKYEANSDETITVPNAEYTLYNLDGSVFATMKTDENGRIEFRKIPYGEYILKETAAPFGYALNEEEIPVSVTENGQTFEFDVEDQRILTSILVQKQCRVSDVFLPNTEFTLFDAETNQAIDSVVTDENGFAAFLNVPYGNYVIKETNPPEGYANDSAPITITVNESFNSAERLSFKNSPIPQTGVTTNRPIALLILTALLFVLSIIANVRAKSKA